MTPSATFSVSAATPSFLAASSIRIARTSAPARRSAVPLFSTDWLPAVMPSFGVRPVSPEIILTRASGRSSSSAAICASAVRMPCPSSTLPVNTVAVPSALMREPGARACGWSAGCPAGAAAAASARAGSRREGEHDAAKPGGEIAACQMGSVHDQVLPSRLGRAQDGAHDAVVACRSGRGCAASAVAHLRSRSAADCGRAAPSRS